MTAKGSTADTREAHYRLLVVGLALLALSTAAYGAGLSWMTHLHHQMLALLEPPQVRLLEAAYAGLAETLVLPTGLLGLLCAGGLLALRPAGVPVILLLLALALALAPLTARLPGWEPWAELLHMTGSIRLPNGELHPAYRLHMEILWLRILPSALSVLVNAAIALLVMAGRRSGRRRAPRREPGEARGVRRDARGALPSAELAGARSAYPSR